MIKNRYICAIQFTVIMEINEIENLNLEEVIAALVQIGACEDRMERNREVDALKAAFYRELGKQKAAKEAELKAEGMEQDAVTFCITESFAQTEHRFKTMLADYKNERSAYLAKQDAERKLNLERKKAVINELKALVDSSLDDINLAFPKLRELQAVWRETGPVPASDFREINDTYQFLVEKFYDMVKINHDLRDLDFKKNLEAKEGFCQQAEQLAQSDNVVEAFSELQKLHEQWKEYGPVAKDQREAIWDRFKAASATINKKYQEHFEQLKAQQEENLAAKTAMCEELEAVVAQDYKSAGAWNAASKKIEEIQARWRKTGFATRKENQKIYERMRAACDAFFDRKKQFFASAKDEQNANEVAKLSIIEQAEALVSSTDWKQTTEQFLSLQAQWKKIGPTNHRKSEELWKRFRAACDKFFEERDKNAKPENNYYGNLKAKKAIIAEIEAWEGTDEEAALKDFTQRFGAIGFVPFKEKDNIQKAFKEAVKAKFPNARAERRPAGGERKPSDPRQELVARYRALQQDIATSENNLGFFKAGSALLEQMQEGIDKSKAELKAIEARIRELDSEAQAE